MLASLGKTQSLNVFRLAEKNKACTSGMKAEFKRLKMLVNGYFHYTVDY